jgi:sugar phosphate isomerase/epimerase
MKYSFMTFSCPDLDLQGTLNVAKQIGYDGIEPRLVADHQHGIEVDIDADARTEIRQVVSESGIALACLATSCMFADPETQMEHVEFARKAIDLAADLGSRAIRVFGGKIGNGLGRQQAINLVAASLSQVSGRAAERGVTVCMETHDDWCDPADVVQIMERVNSPAVAVNWDIMHPVRMRLATMDEAFLVLKPWIRHVHIHDAAADADGMPTLDFAPIGEGYVDHKSAIAQLLSMSYDGYLSGEWINWSDPYDVHLPRELATVKGYE